MEEWKTIIMAPKYECSNLGRVRNKNNGRILKYKKIPDGYLKSSLTTNTGHRIIKFTHRLVALTWIENPENKPTVDHINGKRDDNRVINLQWATHKEQYANIPKENRYKNSGRKVWKCNKDTGEEIELYDNIRQAALSINKLNSTDLISKCANNNREEAFGYKWKFDIQEENVNEEWKLYVKSNDNKYYVSNYGRVKNNDRLLKIGTSGGYNTVYLDNKTQKCHIIVAKIFLPNSNNCPVVNHKDGNKLNNHVSNLEWVSIQENVQHSIENGLNPLHKKIINYDDNGTILGVYINCADAGRKLNVNKSSVHKCCLNQIQTCGENKLKFKYLDENDDIENMKIHAPKKEEKGKFDMSHLYRKVVCYNDDSNILNIFGNSKEAGRVLGVSGSSVLECCQGKRKTCGGKKFKYLDDSDNTTTMKIDPAAPKTIPPNPLYKKIAVYDKQDNLIEICNSKAEVVRKYKVNIDTVTKHCLNKTPHPNINYIFKYAN